MNRKAARLLSVWFPGKNIGKAVAGAEVPAHSYAFQLKVIVQILKHDWKVCKENIHTGIEDIERVVWMKDVDDTEIRRDRLIPGKAIKVSSRWLVIGAELVENSFLRRTIRMDNP